MNFKKSILTVAAVLTLFTSGASYAAQALGPCNEEFYDLVNSECSAWGYHMPDGTRNCAGYESGIHTFECSYRPYGNGFKTYFIDTDENGNHLSCTIQYNVGFNGCDPVGP